MSAIVIILIALAILAVRLLVGTVRLFARGIPFVVHAAASAVRYSIGLVRTIRWKRTIWRMQG